MRDLWTIKVQKSLTNVELHVLRLLDNSLILSNCSYNTLQLSKNAVKRFPGDTFWQQALEQSTEMCERIQRRVTLEKVISGSKRETKERLRDARHSGNFLQIPYPWIKKAMLERSKAIMHEASGAMRQKSNGVCKVDRSAVGGPGNAHFFGVFAKEDIQAQ